MHFQFRHTLIASILIKVVILRFKRFTDASFFIFDVSPSVRKASSEITNAHSKHFWKCEKIHNELKIQLIYDITLKLLLRKKNIRFCTYSISLTTHY